jgi:hypothetical protein
LIEAARSAYREATKVLGEVVMGLRDPSTVDKALEKLEASLAAAVNNTGQ